MYLSSTLAQLYRALRARDPKAARPVPRAVVRLGITSLLTDVASEMVDTILPLYALYALELSPFAVGALDGLYHAATTLARIGTAIVADRMQRLKEAAFVGYALSLASRVVLAFAGGGSGALFGAIAIDRAGKGLRAAPRDAMIALAAAPEARAAAFATHRALDSIGSVLGPLLGFVLLLLAPLGFDVVFVASAGIALVGLLYFALFVEPPAARDASAEPAAGSAGPARARGGFAAIVAIGALTSAGEVSPALLFVAVRERAGIGVTSVPLLQVGAAVACALSVVPLGRIADRVGPLWVYLFGQALLVAGYLVVLGVPGWAGVIGVVALVGAHYAGTEGVLVALASSVLPRARLATGLSLLSIGALVARIGGSLAFGALWQRVGTTAAIGAAAGITALSTLPIALAARPSERARA
ncbi:MAG: MFS transporter [Polyangiaceae bacterium]